MLQAAKARVRKSLPARIVATDIDPQAIRTSRQHAEAAAWIRSSISARGIIPDPHTGRRGVVILNPEYGERMERSSS